MIGTTDALVDSLDALDALAELRQAAAAQLAYLAELTRWAGELTAALNANLPRRYGVSIAPPQHPAGR